MIVQQNNGFDAADDELIARFTAFTVRTVTSAKIDYIRRQRHWKWEVSVEEISDMSDDAPTVQRWQNGVSNNEFFFAEERISNALSALPILRRRILELSFIEGLSAQEVADELSCSVNYVYKLKHETLKRLRDALLKGGE